MGRRPARRNQPPRFTDEARFTQSQIQHMEKAILDAKDVELNQSFFQKIAREMNFISRLTGQRAIQWRQVKAYYEHHHAVRSSSSGTMSNGQVNTPDISFLRKTLCIPDNATQRAADSPAIEFEAKSARDGAWYDIAAFIDQRTDTSGELEVRVRYQGFSPEDDEWVNLKQAVRTRSIPLESSECCKITVGDVVLCFLEEGDEAAHFDAHVIEIERKLHDIRGCRCIFLIRYDHDQAEERVHLRRLCRRP